MLFVSRGNFAPAGNSSSNQVIFVLCVGKPSCTESNVDSHPRSSRLRYLARWKVHCASGRGN